jgi:purine-nucleoside phosphorylase
MSGTKSHRGILKVGKKLLIFAGRFHLYEGFEMDDIVLSVFIFKALGGKNLIVTNAAGGVNREYIPGDLICIKDHINLMGQSPLRGRNDDTLGPRFPDIKSAYTRELIDIAKNQTVCELKEGIYAAVQGPNYETCAEANMLRTIGADMVGMSTVPEVIAASYIGLRVLGISCISNKVGVIEEPVSHEEVIMTGKKVSARFSALLDHILSKI